MASLYVVLDTDSVAKVRALARHPELRGDHVTLVMGIRPEKLEPQWIPGGHAIGDPITFRATGHCDDGRVQVLIIEIDGSRIRPWDEGILHITVSRVVDARSRDANALVTSSIPEPIDLPLSGVIKWHESAS